jgi:DNA adenine methylase
MRKDLSPLLKWAWGKEQELKHIVPALPENFNNYYEPFVWWGAVYFSLPANKYFINDKSEELIWLYKILTSKDKKG